MKSLIGKVVSTKMHKTVVVRVERFFTHPLYEKRIRKAKKYHVHDEIGAGKGDKVRFTETKPLSRTKKWKVIEIIKV